MTSIPINFSNFNVKLFNFAKNRLICAINVQHYRPSSNDVKQNTSDEVVIFENDEDDELEKEAIIESKRNKSRLNQEHRNILYKKVPYSQPMSVTHTTVIYNRKMFGRYGEASGISPRIAWPTKEDLADLKEYESVAYPFTIQEMVQKAQNNIVQENKRIEENQAKIAQQLLKLDNWKAEIEARATKKLAAAVAAKEKKEKLIEEVRRHFGFKVDPRDDRFKEMLAQKEKAEKKKAKEIKRKAKEDEFLSKLVDKNKDIN